MSSELSLLALYGLLIVVTIFAQVLLATPQQGIAYLVTARDEGRKLTGAAGRLERATINCLIGFGLFAAAILVLNAKQEFTATTLLLAQVVFWTRVVYVVLYGAAVPWLRTLVWTVSILATAWLLVLAL